jgi:hypothetical protein
MLLSKVGAVQMRLLRDAHCATRIQLITLQQVQHVSHFVNAAQIVQPLDRQLTQWL